MSEAGQVFLNPRCLTYKKWYAPWFVHVYTHHENVSAYHIHDEISAYNTGTDIDYGDVIYNKPYQFDICSMMK